MCIRDRADKVNKYLDMEKPWVKIKSGNDKDLVHRICTDGLNSFRILIGYLKPVLPSIAIRVENILSCDPLTWNNIEELIFEKEINKFEKIIARIDIDSIELMKNKNKGENND